MPRTSRPMAEKKRTIIAPFYLTLLGNGSGGALLRRRGNRRRRARKRLSAQLQVAQDKPDLAVVGVGLLQISKLLYSVLLVAQCVVGQAEEVLGIGVVGLDRYCLLERRSRVFCVAV